MLNISIDKSVQYEIISISELVLNNYLLRKVDAILDLNFVYELVDDKGRITINMVKVIRFWKIEMCLIHSKNTAYYRILIHVHQ